MDEINLTVSGNRSARILETIQTMIINLFMPVYLNEKYATVGTFICSDRNIRITVESVPKSKGEIVENSN